MADEKNNQTTDNGSNYNPLAEPVVERDYSTPEINFNDQAPIDEPLFATTDAPLIETAPDVRDQQKPEDTTSPAANAATNDLNDKDKKIAAQTATKVMLDGYGKFWGFAGRLAKISERKLGKEIRNGNINERLMLPVDTGSGPQEISLQSFVQAYNGSIDEALSVDEDFVKEISPVLTRVLMKRGIGMTDEQLLLWILGKDVAVKLQIGFQFMQNSKDMMATFREMSPTADYGHQTQQNAPHKETVDPVNANTKTQADEDYISRAETKHAGPEKTEPEVKTNDFVDNATPEPEFHVSNVVSKEDTGFAEAEVLPGVPIFGNVDNEELENVAEQMVNASRRTRGKKK